VREGIHVRYVGEGVREVPGVGVFAKGTVAWVPRAIALEILREDCFVAEGSGKPASALVIRLGQKPSHEPNPPAARSSASDAASRAADAAALEIEPDDLAARLAAGDPIFLVDVREPWEHETAALDDAVLAPMSAAPASLEALRPPEGALVVCYCHHGVRSLAAANHLRRRGVAPGAVSLKGGIDRWSDEIDPTIPRY
jgi:rhodanese-related sulfurtransferase